MGATVVAKERKGVKCANPPTKNLLPPLWGKVGMGVMQRNDVDD
jgi:hypothetical protein